MLYLDRFEPSRTKLKIVIPPIYVRITIRTRLLSPWDSSDGEASPLYLPRLPPYLNLRE